MFYVLNKSFVLYVRFCSGTFCLNDIINKFKITRNRILISLNDEYCEFQSKNSTS